MRFFRCLHPRDASTPILARVCDDTQAAEIVSEYSDTPGTGETFPLSAIKTWLPPVDPPNILAIGKNYPDHARELGGQNLPDAPILFLKATTTLTAHQQPIRLPKTHPDEVDYEAELAVIIGKTAKHVSRENAYDYILGYACSHDVSARDCQLRLDKQWARGKSFDTFCPLGPYLVTDIDPADLHVKMYRNGELMQDQSTKEMLFDIPALIEYLSAAMTLLPHTVILTGTPCGVGAARTPPVYLREGDTMRVEIDSVGVLENPIVREV